MTQNNTFRKEPTFGEASAQKNSTANETLLQSNPSMVSLHSKTSPGFTFNKPLNHTVKISDNPDNPDVNASNVMDPKIIEKNFESMAEDITAQQELSAEELAFKTAIKDMDTATEENVEKGKEGEAVNERTINVQQTEQVKTESFTTERVIPSANNASASIAMGAAAAVTAAKTELGQPKIPAKVRRLLLVALAALALLVIFFLLKPSTPETIEELQSQQGSSLPIEFRPVDEAEAKRAEEQARAEQEALEAQQALQQQQNQIQQQQEIQSQQESASTQQVTVEVSQQTVGAAVPAKVLENKPVIAQSQTQSSVVHRPENSTRSPVTRTETKVVTSKPAQQKETAKIVKPAADKTQVNKTTSAVAASSKTLTVPKGVSLMQVFRDNNLNIADVNAMSKVNNRVSNLKAGERVTVRLDKNNRVVEMTIGSGGKFIRQANGSYTFK